MDCLCLCLPSKSKSKGQIATTLAVFLAAASDCTENSGLLAAQALLQLTAKLAQQANSLSSVKMLWLTAHCFASQTDTTEESWPIFTDSTALLRLACLWLSPAAVQQTCPAADIRFSRSTHSQGQSFKANLQLALQKISAALIPPAHAFDGVPPGRTASQIELSLHTNYSA